MNRILRKMVMIVMCISLMMTTLPNHGVNAQDAPFLVEVKPQDLYQKIIEITDVEFSLSEVQLWKEGALLETKTSPELTSFEVFANGQYQVIGKSTTGEVLLDQSLVIDDFDSLSIQASETGVDFEVVSRYRGATILINDQLIERAQEVKPGVFSYPYTTQKNGDYRVVVQSETKEVLEEGLYQEKRHLSAVTEVILVSTEKELEQLIAQPSGHYQLSKDIELTADLLKDVEFSGVLDGNGYAIMHIEDRLFSKLINATILNIGIEGRLAESSSHSQIVNSGFYLEMKDEEKDSALILESDQTLIKDSFVLMNIEAKNAAGFVLKGTAEIERSYVSGYALAVESVYGFGQEVQVKNSYLTASLIGETRVLFTDAQMTDNFYDLQVNTMEESRATPLSTKDMTSMNTEYFKSSEGAYPEVTAEFKETAQKLVQLSTVALQSTSHLAALEADVLWQEADDIVFNALNATDDGTSASLNGSEGEIIASNEFGWNRFALASPQSIPEVKVGVSTTAQTTQLSIPTQQDLYYIVKKSAETSSEPKSHEAALDSGWKKVYWTGSINWTQLEWYTEYTVYSTDLATLTEVSTIRTLKGKNGGNLTLTGNYEVGETLRVTLSGARSMEGKLYWETATTLDANAQWTLVKEETLSASTTSGTYEVTANEKTKYLRARFTPAAHVGYEGELITNTSSSIKEALTKVEIKNSIPSVEGQLTLHDELYAQIEPDKISEVNISWHHEGDPTVIGTGVNYQIKAADVGKAIYALATAKTDGDLKGSAQSAVTSVVQGIKNATPNASNIEKIATEDITATLKMKAAGLYRFKTENPSGESAEFAVLARGNTSLTITGLTANTSYKVYVQQVGERGYNDSDYSSDFFEVQTDLAHVIGDIILTGDAIYQKTLTATIVNEPENQTGTFEWYRLDSEGERIEDSKGAEVTYDLGAADIGAKIEVIYKGTGLYAGEIALSTDVIGKEEKTAPLVNATVSGSDDTTITVQLPANSEGEKYIIGVSPTQTGVPIEVLENGVIQEFAAESTYQILGLDRDSDYYISVRYAENSTHLKSDWIESAGAVHQKTSKKTLTGSIDFKYEAATLMKGYTLVAELNPTDATFNYKGEWKWIRIDASSTETEITDYVLTDNKQGTKYLVPENEVTGITYRVEFTANVGYEGTLKSAPSLAVLDVVMGQYSPPDSNQIEMEMVDESSIKVKMTDGEGQYQFYYKKADTSLFESMGGVINNILNAEDGYTAVGNPVYSSTDVLIEGLARNTNYIVKVQRVTDSKGEASAFSYSSDANISATTDKTEIAGYVTIDGINRYGEVLTAAYQAATYASTGDGADTEGQWQWYLGNAAISGETNSTYTIKEEDVTKVLKAEYYMGDDRNFKGKSSAETSMILKASGNNPEVTNIITVQDRTNDEISVQIAATASLVGQKVYYRVQKESVSAPDFPMSEEALGTWSENATGNMNLTIDSDKGAFKENGKYVLYIFVASSSTRDGSSIIPISFTVGKKAQLGNITFAGRTHVSKEVTATLNTPNNTQGSWEWYYSTTNYTTAQPSTWTKITDGYSPKENEATSTLVVPDEAKGRFLKAEFVSTNENVTGTISSGKSATSVTKTSTEVLTITGKGYAGEIITVEVSGSDRDFTVDTDFGTKIIQFRKANNAVDNNQAEITKRTKNTLVFTLKTTITAEYNNSSIYAVVNQPDKNIYTQENGSALAGDYLYSDLALSIPYLYGTPISNTADLFAFMEGTGNYSDRDKTYVLTNNINMSSKGAASVTETPFTGIIDGNFHTISYSKNPLIYSVTGTVVKYAEVKNIIFANGVVNSLPGALGYQTGAVASKVGHYTKINKIFASNSVVNIEQNGGLITGFIDADTAILDPLRATIIISECGAAGGGLVKTSTISASVGGFAGFAPSGIFMDNFSVANNIKSTYGNLGGFIGHGSRRGGDTIQRNYTTATFDFPTGVGKPKQFGGVIAEYVTNLAPVNLSSNYYDKQVVNNVEINNASAANPAKGTGLVTTEMIGTKLQTSLGNASWTYRTGYYPVLTWIKDHPAAILYTSTRGGFLSVDGLTSAGDMFGGIISGSIVIPQDLQTPDFKVITSDATVLKVVNNTIIPVGAVNTKATITITYSEPDPTIGGSASNTYEFTVKKQMTSFNSVVVNGVARYGDTLTAIAQGATTFQWYRRKSGEYINSKIASATKGTYEVKPEDIGYQLSVEVGATGYAKTMSGYTDVVISAAPATGPTKVRVTDSSITIKQEGIEGLKYEFSYTTDANLNKTILQGEYGNNIEVSTQRLARNANYQWYTRVAAGTGYAASGWSPLVRITTEKTELVGDVSLGANLNNGSTLSMNIPSTNNQTGVWKIERTDTGGNVESVISSNYSTSATANYTLVAADVGKKIKVTFTGSDDYKGSKSALSGVIKKANVGTPNTPTIVSSTANSMEVKVEASGNIDLGYAEEIGGTIIIAMVNQASNTNLTLSGLNRNKNYYIYARLAETAASETSAWSSAGDGKTEKIAVANTISTESINLVTGSMLIMTPPTTQGERPTGTWKVERVTGLTTTTISPSNYQTSAADGKLNYLLSPKDAGAKIKATFLGNGDFTSSAFFETSAIGLGTQSIEGMSSAVTVSNAKEYEMDVVAVDGIDIYQFGYAKTTDSVVNEFEATAGAGKNITINNLQRNSEYDIYIRKAAKTGYAASEWVKKTQGKTTKSPLTGTIKYNIKEGDVLSAPKIGVASIGVTYQAEYAGGNYGQVGDDTNVGTWQWYADEVKIEGATSTVYTVAPMTGIPEISVRYIADESSDFSSYRSANIGTLTKPKFDAPELPTVVAMDEDGRRGSKLAITNSKYEAVYYFVQKSSNSTVPPVVIVEKVEENEEKEDQWFKASTENIINLEPNTEYVVYAAKLENTEYQASGVISHRSVKTVKENLEELNSAEIFEADTAAIWKTAQAKELRITNEDKAPTGVWQYYVSSTPTLNSSWANITFEVIATEGKTAEYAYTKINIPLKYTGNYTVRAVFIGRGEYEGRKVYTATTSLEGKPLSGKVELNLGSAAEVFVPIQAQYVSADDKEVDDENGTWTWYREETINSGNFVIIETPNVQTGVTGSYTPTGEDSGKKIYATYSGATNGIYSGSVQSDIISDINRTAQNSPTDLILKQVDGLTVQITLPSNYKTDGKTIPEVVLEYRIKGTDEWTLNKVSDAWIGKQNKLRARTEYEVRAKFIGTNEYEPSPYTSILEVTTSSDTFDQSNLKIDAPAIIKQNDLIEMSYTGDGFDDGYFVVERSDGTIANKRIDGTTAGNEVKASYVVTKEDEDNNIIIKYQAKEDALRFGGFVEKNTIEVIKIANPSNADKPVLEKIRLEETQLIAQVSKEYEYVLTDSMTAISTTSSAWKKLSGETAEAYTFSDLTSGTTYYLHARLAETALFNPSTESVSDGVTPWVRQTYSITYDLDFGDNDATNPVEYTELTPTIILIDPTKTGYTFDGWIINDGDTPKKNMEIVSGSDGNKTFKARWSINSYTMTFDSKGGDNNATIVKDFDVELGTLPVTTKEGYAFSGWFDAQEEGTEITSTTKMPAANSTAYARWTPTEYTITYEMSDGENDANNPSNFTIETPTFTLKEPTKTGYTFVGWTKDSEPEPKKIVEIALGSITNRVYNAVWEISKYTVDFAVDDGTPIDDQTIEHGSSVTEPKDPPTKKGYTFAGWYKDTTLNNVWDFAADKVTEATTLYAKWTINQYTMTFNSNGGDNNNATIVNDFDVELGTLPVTIKEGYTFIGWFDAQEGGTEITATTKMPATASTVYARWTINQYTMTFNSNGGDNNNSTIVKDFDVELGTLPVTTKEGYTFIGWFDAQEDGTEITATTKMPATASTVYARWTINKYDVTFNSNGGGTVTTQSIEYNNLVTVPTVPTKTGYSFAGWYKETTLNNVWDFATDKVTEATTLYAKWTINSYTITFDSNEGSAVTTQNIDYDNLVTVPTAPTKTGYTFAGWYKETTLNNVWDFATDKVTEATTLYAKWIINQYTMTFNSNGGDNNNAAIVSDFDVELGTLPVTTKEGYTFKGWFDAQVDGTEITATTKMPATASTVYARWTINKYDVTFNSNGGGTVTTQSIEYNNLVGEPTAPTKTGHTFAGWYREIALTNKWDFETNQVTEATTLYAKWTINQYTMTFDSKGGDNNNAAIVSDFDVELGTLPVTTKEGYTFNGWFDAPEGGAEITSMTKMPADNSTVYARWTINQYTMTFDSKDGDNNNTTIVKDFDVELGTLPVTTKEGYTFNGWFDAPEGGTEITSVTKMPADNSTVYARWTATEYTITYEMRNGENDANNPSNFTIETPTFTLNEPTKTGYTFVGWTKDSETEPKKIVEIALGSTTNRVYKAVWEINKYTVNFAVDDGTPIDDQTIEHGSSVTEPEDAPTKTGYTFAGWYKETALTNKWDFESNKVTEATTLYAKWTINKYDVTFESNGGGTVTTQNIDYNNFVSVPTAPTKTGYTFAGWYKDAELSNEWNFASDAVTEATTLYAKWTAISYTITYTLDGGSVDPINPTGYTIETATFILNTPTKTGYNFVGWTIVSGATPQMVVEIMKGTTGNLDYIANYELKNFAVKFVTNSPSVIEDQSIPYGQKATQPENPSKEGYQFEGWYKEETFITQWNFATDSVENEMRLYAKYTEILRPVTASVATNSTLDKGSAVSLSAKSGATILYTLDGSEPNSGSAEYTGPIIILNTVELKVKAKMADHVESAVTTFMYFVKGEADLSISGNVSTKTPMDQLIEAVVSEEEYPLYLTGTAVKIEISKKQMTLIPGTDISGDLKEGELLGELFEVEVYKTVGNQPKTSVTTLNKAIDFVFDLPDLNTPTGVKRTFGLYKKLQNGLEVVEIKAVDLNTLAFDLQAAGTYILSYKDEIVTPTPQPSIAPVPTTQPVITPSAHPSAKPTSTPSVTAQPQEEAHFESGGIKVTAEELIEMMQNQEISENSYAFKKGYTMATFIDKLTSTDSHQMMEDVVRTSAIATKMRVNRNSQISETDMAKSLELVLAILEPNEIVKALTSTSLSINLEVDYPETQAIEVLEQLNLQDKEHQYAVNIQLYKEFENEDAVLVLTSATPIELNLLGIGAGVSAEFIALTQAGNLVVYQDLEDQDEGFSFKTTELNLRGVVVTTMKAETNNWTWFVSIMAALVLFCGTAMFYMKKKKDIKS